MPQESLKLAGSIREKRVNPDLLEEREKLTFDKKELSLLTWGEEHYYLWKKIE